MYVVRSQERDRLAAALTAAGISCASYYVTPMHLQQAMLYLGGKPGDLPATEQASRENLAIPMWAGIEADLQERIVSVMRGGVATKSAA